ncbi:MAG: glycine cleavage system transcriptional repressor, partial [Actinomycetota bacterium]|nr:glycine cleavage system transcriptional repressor [Actinomycetota bacterium]
MPHLAVTALGADRPGIVSAVTGVLVEQGCNLEDTSMSILRGRFAMMLVVSAPDAVSAEALEGALAGAADRFDLMVAVRAIDDTVPQSPQGEPYALSVYGADKPGIVHRVAAALADLGVNVVDLATRVIGGTERPVYAMLLDVTLPPGIGAEAVEGRLEEVCGDLALELSLHPAYAYVLLPADGRAGGAAAALGSAQAAGR